MLARSATKPKLTLSVATTTATTARPSLSLSTAVSAPRSPLSPMPPAASPSTTVTPITLASRNALNQRGGSSTLQVPSYAYSNEAGVKSALKKASSSGSASAKGGKVGFSGKDSVKCVSPLPRECHGGYGEMTREERRWTVRD
jgi:hypothetical protein